MELPPEIIVNHIINILPYRDVLVLSNINTLYHGMCNDEYIWSKLYKRDYDKIDIPKYNNLNTKHRYRSITQMIDRHMEVLTQSCTISIKDADYIRQTLIQLLADLCVEDIQTHGNNTIMRTIDDIYKVVREFVSHDYITGYVYGLLHSIDYIVYYTNEQRIKLM